MFLLYFCAAHINLTQRIENCYDMLYVKTKWLLGLFHHIHTCVTMTYIQQHPYHLICTYSWKETHSAVLRIYSVRSRMWIKHLRWSVSISVLLLFNHTKDRETAVFSAIHCALLIDIKGSGRPACFYFLIYNVTVMLLMINMSWCIFNHSGKEIPTLFETFD